MFGLREIRLRQLLVWFSIGLILILVTATFIQHQGKTVAESPALSTRPTPNPQSKPDRLRLSAQFTQKIFSKFPEAKVELDCFVKEKYGFMDTTGKLVIPLCFDEVRPFSNGVARVKFDSQNFGYINREGVLVVALIRDNRTWNDDFSEDRLALRREKNGKFGYIDRAGKFVIEPQFDEAYSFHEGRAGVCSVTGPQHIVPETFQHRRCGYIDPTGRVVIPQHFVQVHPFENGFAVVVSPKYKKGNPDFNEYLLGVINDRGQFLVEPNLDFVGLTYRDTESENEIRQFPDTPFASGLLRVRIPDSRTPPPRAEGDYSTDPYGLGKWGYIRKTGGYAIEPRFWKAHDFSSDRAVVQIGEDDTGYPAQSRGKWAMIDPTGRIIELANHKQGSQPDLQSIWGSGTSFSEGVIAAGTSNDLYGYMDRNGEWVIEPQFDDTNDFSNGLAAVIPRGQKTWGYIDHHGKLVIPAQYDSVKNFVNGFAVVQIGDSYGIINRQGQYVLELQKYKYIDNFVDGIAELSLNEYSSRFFVTTSGKTLPYTSSTNSTIKKISEGLIIVSGKLPDGFKP